MIPLLVTCLVFATWVAVDGLFRHRELCRLLRHERERRAAAEQHAGRVELAHRRDLVTAHAFATFAHKAMTQIAADRDHWMAKAEGLEHGPAPRDVRMH